MSLEVNMVINPNYVVTDNTFLQWRTINKFQQHDYELAIDIHTQYEHTYRQTLSHRTHSVLSHANTLTGIQSSVVL